MKKMEKFAEQYRLKNGIPAKDDEKKVFAYKKLDAINTVLSGKNKYLPSKNSFKEHWITKFHKSNIPTIPHPQNPDLKITEDVKKLINNMNSTFPQNKVEEKKTSIEKSLEMIKSREEMMKKRDKERIKKVDEMLKKKRNK